MNVFIVIDVVETIMIALIVTRAEAKVQNIVVDINFLMNPKNQ
jgi:hypothetical protein